MEVASERGKSARTETLRVRGVERYAAGDLLAAAALWREALTLAPEDIQAQAYVAWVESRLAMEQQVPGTSRGATSVPPSVFSAETVDPIGELAVGPSEGGAESAPGWHQTHRGIGAADTNGVAGFDGVEAPVRRFLAHTPTRPNLAPLDDVPVLNEEKIAELAALQQGGRPPAANGQRRTLPPVPAGAVPSPSETPTRVVQPDPAAVARAAAPSPATIVVPAAPAQPPAATPPTPPAPAVAPPSPSPRGPVASPFRAPSPSSGAALRSPTPSPFARAPDSLSSARTTTPGTPVRPAAPPSSPSQPGGGRAPTPVSPSTLRGAVPRRGRPVTVEMEAEPEDRGAARPSPSTVPPAPRRPSGPVARVDEQQAVPRRVKDDPSGRRGSGGFSFAERTMTARLAYDRGDLEGAIAIAEELVAAAGGIDAEVLAEHSSKLVMIYEKVLGRRDRLVRLGDLPPSLDPRSAFVLSRVDGSFSIDDLIDVSGMDRAQASRLVALMLRSGALVAG